MHFLPAESVLDRADEGFRGAGFAVDDAGLPGRLVETGEPVEQRRLVGVRRKTADGADFGAHGHRLPEDAHDFRAIDEASPERAGGLEAGDQDGAFAARQVFAQVVFDASGFAHAAGRDDDRAAAHVVEGARFVDVADEVDLYLFDFFFLYLANLIFILQ